MNNKKRKRLLITGDFPPIPGGESEYYYNLIRYLSPSHIIVLTTRAYHSEKIDKKVKFKIIRREVGALSKNIFIKILKPLLFTIYTMPIIKKEKVQTIFCGQALTNGICGYIYKKLFNIPYYVFLFGGEFIHYKKLRLPISPLKKILNNAESLIVIGEFIKGECMKIGIREEKIVTISPAVDTTRFHPQIDYSELVEKNNLYGKKVILTVCRIEDYKGIDIVINSLPRVLEKVPEISYIVVGTGSYLNVLKEIVETLSLSAYVIFAGYVPSEVLPKYYNLCDVFIMPSREIGLVHVEGFGIVYLEANACGKPVIGGKSGGIKDAVIDGVTGLLVDPTSIDEIANTLVKLLKDKEYRKKLGEQGRKRVEQKFRWEERARIIKKLL